MFDTIVIGAGIGGLTSAIALGASGNRVLVVEAADAPGGKAGQVELEGMTVDTGPSVLTMPDVFRTVLSLVDMKLEDELTLLSPNPGFRYIYPDGVELDVFHGVDDTLASVERTLGQRPASELRGYLEYAAGIWNAAAPAFVYGDAPTWKTLFGGGLGILAKLARIDPLSTMWGSIKRRVKSPHLRMLLARYATYNGSDVRSAPATLGCISHVELAMGGFGVRGGMYELVRTLVRAAKRAGVQLQCGSPVKRIRVEAGAVTGVQLAGAFIPARTVVANANVAATATLLGSVVDHQIRSQQTPSMSGFNSIVRARHSQTRAPHTVLFPKDYLEEFADIFDRDQPPQDPTVYVCAQQRCHARAGWSDSEPLFLMANAPAEPAGRARTDGVWQALELRVMQRLRDANLLSAGYRTLWRRSPTELAARFPGSRGAIYGSASNNSAAAFQRPANRVSAVRGLYLASGSAHPGGGIPLAALSGLAAARALSVDESNTCAK